ncbi:MAG: hypothetical protein MSIBF_03210 [Candidatus Altiarchaeales archaeon IMC4]|nr:MAG: hypothetical protein MSIBF_03210 [Candidatus Altiarchaeales archaeon IMC4]
MIDDKFFEQLKNIDFITRKRISSLYSGSRKSIKLGRGIETISYREYQPGDDFRTIDWRIYARSEKLYVRMFEEEKNLDLHVLVDASSSMSFTTGDMTKFDYGGSLAAGFDYVSSRKNERFATSLYSKNLKLVTQPKRGKTHFFRIIDFLNDAELEGETDLSFCMKQYGAMVKNKSFFVIISDFMEPIGSLRDGIWRAAKNSKELVLVQVLDPGEIELKWLGDAKLEDLETHGVERTYLGPSFKKQYKKRMEDHVFQIKEICDEVNAQFFSVRTDVPLVDNFISVLGMAH